MKKNKLIRILLHKDSFLLIACLVWLWFTISFIVDERSGKKDLQQHTGRYNHSQIVITRIKDKPLYKDTTRELRLGIHNYPAYFTTSTSGNFNYILEELGLEDTISIYTKEKKWGVFGFASASDIVHLVNEQTGKVIIDYQKRRADAASLKYLTGFFTIAFTFWYVFQVRKRLYWDN